MQADVFFRTAPAVLVADVSRLESVSNTIPVCSATDQVQAASHTKTRQDIHIVNCLPYLWLSSLWYVY